VASAAEPQDLRLRWVCLAVGLVVAAWGLLGVPARAKEGEQVMADEPQYLLSALSLAEDRDLWIDDELAAERYRPFYDIILPVQTERLDSGHAASPHDPLLPVLLAVPMGLGGWVAAKVTLVALAGVLAGLLTWVAHRRLAVPLGVAAGTVLAFGMAAPLTAYASQVYPELPAALAVIAAVACLTAPAVGRRTTAGWAVAVVALPWLGVKYAPVAVALAALGLLQLWRAGDRQWRLALVTVGGLALAGAAYLVVHRLIYGGWTVYAAGDHFVDGQLTVMGHEPNYTGRSRRLVGLLLDQGFGLAAWMPGYLLAVPALGVLARRRPPGWTTLVVPLAAGWATATWVALTMHGWWWPGRQTVVVLPCAVLAVAWWVGQVRSRIPFQAVVATGIAGAVTWLWLVVEVLQRGDVTLIGTFEATSNPLYRAWRAALPDFRHLGTGDWLLTGLWLAALIAGTMAAVGSSRRRPDAAGDSNQNSDASHPTDSTRSPTHVPA
jgi:hypothetical protein